MKTIPLIYAIAYATMNANLDDVALHAGVVIVEPGQGTLGVIKDSADAMGMSVHVIRMSVLGTSDLDVAELRKDIDDTIAKGRKTIFVLSDAQAAPGDMLKRTADAIVAASTATCSTILAIGHEPMTADEPVDVDGISDVLATAIGRTRADIAGSSTFMTKAKTLFDSAMNR